MEQLGNWPASRFETAWNSYCYRRDLDRLEVDRRTTLSAIISSGAGGDDQKKVMEDIDRKFKSAREDIMVKYDPRFRPDVVEPEEGEYEAEEWWQK